jgi:hypothetical protein
MNETKRRWLIALKGEDNEYNYYPDDSSFFVGNDLEVHIESEKRANEWEKKHGCICFGILCESHGKVKPKGE